MLQFGQAFGQALARLVGQVRAGQEVHLEHDPSLGLDLAGVACPLPGCPGGMKHAHALVSNRSSTGSLTDDSLAARHLGVCYSWHMTTM